MNVEAGINNMLFFLISSHIYFVSADLMLDFGFACLHFTASCLN